jgi:hypothetical protein
MVIVMAEDQAIAHPLAAAGTSRAGGGVEPILPPILPPRPTPTQGDGVLRQSDVRALPAPVPGHGFIYRLLDPVTAERAMWVAVARRPFGGTDIAAAGRRRRRAR